MKTKKINLSIILLFSFVTCFSQVKEVTPGEITICASTPIPDGVKATTQSYKDLIDCGFNLGMAKGSISYFKEQFKLIGDLNFKYLVGSGDLLTDNRINYIKAFSKDKHLGGWRFSDEPQYAKLNELSSQYKAMCKADPEHLVYLNLVGVLEKIFTGNLKTFSEYLNLIEQKFNPEIWSYDYYPILTKNGKLTIKYDQFYASLEDFYAISKKTKKPFWAYCESMQYKTRSYSRPAATESYLRFEAFSALAYGAQGIVYWTYGQRESSSTETYQSALVNRDGKKSSAWNAAKKVNGEIKKFNDVFYKCDVVEVKHTGRVNYKGTKNLNGAFGPFKQIRTGNNGVILSHIKNNGKEYIVIVSRDVEKTQNLSLTLQANQKVTDITGDVHKNYANGSDINMVMPKGGYFIFQVNN